MFAALADTQAKQTEYYNRTLPNLLLSPVPPNISSPTEFADTVNVYDPTTKKKTSNKADWASFIRGINGDPALNAKASFCRGAKSPEELAGTLNYRDKVRCGWIYKKGPVGSPNPEISEGALGTEKGPLSFYEHSKGGQWYWDLMEAQRRLIRLDAIVLKTVLMLVIPTFMENVPSARIVVMVFQ